MGNISGQWYPRVEYLTALEIHPSPDLLFIGVRIFPDGTFYLGISEEEEEYPLNRVDNHLHNRKAKLEIEGEDT